jgi:hypothetical protein
MSNVGSSSARFAPFSHNGYVAVAKAGGPRGTAGNGARMGITADTSAHDERDGRTNVPGRS